MELVNSGTLAVGGGNILTADSTLQAGVYVLEMDTSPLVNDGEVINVFTAYKVRSADTDVPTIYDDQLYGIQAEARWQSIPSVLPESCAITITVGHNTALATGVGWKLFRTGAATSVDSGTASYTTGGSKTVTGAGAGVYALLLNVSTMVNGDVIKVTSKVDSEIVREVYLQNAQYPDLYQSDPIVASGTGCTVVISFETLSGSTAFSWNLMRVG